MAKTSGGQPGNNNAKRGMEARESLRRSICKLGMKVKADYEEKEDQPFPDDGLTNYEIGMDSVSGNLLIGSKDERDVFKEVADRMDGKSVQAVELSTPDGPIGVTYKMEFPDDGDDPAADAT